MLLQEIFLVESFLQQPQPVPANSYISNEQYSGSFISLYKYLQQTGSILIPCRKERAQFLLKDNLRLIYFHIIKFIIDIWQLIGSAPCRFWFKCLGFKFSIFHNEPGSLQDYCEILHISQGRWGDHLRQKICQCVVKSVNKKPYLVYKFLKKIPVPIHDQYYH